jgi:microcin C transport system permease protein
MDDAAEMIAAAGVHAPQSPGQRAWQRFRRNRLGFASLLALGVLLAASLAAELLSNERPLVARYEGRLYFPVFDNPADSALGGELPTGVDWVDPWVLQRFRSGSGNWFIRPPNPHGADAVDFSLATTYPSRPNAVNWLGTDERGRDMVAALLYGFRISALFGLALTVIGASIGIAAGALQGYFGGRTDLIGQRLIEIWSGLPELYVLIVIASLFVPSILIMLLILSLFGWITLADYVRAEFLRNRNLEYVKGARAIGLGPMQVIVRHVLPNSLTPVITFLPFRMSEAILTLAALDFLGLGVGDSLPSLGDLLRQGHDNLDAWWILLPTFLLLVTAFLLLTFMGNALRDAFDPRKS